MKKKEKERSLFKRIVGGGNITALVHNGRNYTGSR